MNSIEFNNITVTNSNSSIEENAKKNCVKKNGYKNKSLKRISKFLTRIKRFVLKEKGIFLSILSALIVALGGIFYKKAKTISGNIYSYFNYIIKTTFYLKCLGSDDSLIRFFFQFQTMLIIIKYKKLSIFGPKEQRLLLFSRAFFSIFAVISTNFAIKYIDPSDNIALSHTNIIMTAIFARIFLKEKFNISHLISLLLTIGGSLLIAKPSFIFSKKNIFIISNSSFSMDNTSSNLTNFTDVCLITESREIISGWSQLIGVAFALVGALGSAAIHVIIKKLCKNKVHYSVSTIYGSYLGLPASFILSLALILTGSSHKNFHCEAQYLGIDILFGCLGGLCAVFGHVLLNLSLQHEDATKVSIVRTADVVFSFVLQFMILNIQEDWISIIGAVMIVMSTFTILLYKIIEEKRQEQKKGDVDINKK